MIQRGGQKFVWETLIGEDFVGTNRLQKFEDAHFFKKLPKDTGQEKKMVSKLTVLLGVFFSKGFRKKKAPPKRSVPSDLFVPSCN